MRTVGIEGVPHRQVRHGYGLHSISRNVPLNMLRRCMGHIDLETTTIYADRLGEGQQQLAVRM